MVCEQQSIRGQTLEFIITEVEPFDFQDKSKYDIGYNIIVGLSY